MRVERLNQAQQDDLPGVLKRSLKCAVVFGWWWRTTCGVLIALLYTPSLRSEEMRARVEKQGLDSSFPATTARYRKFATRD